MTHGEEKAVYGDKAYANTGCLNPGESSGMLIAKEAPGIH